MDAYHITILIISLLVMLGGLAGIIFPIIPSTPLIWAGVFIYAACDGFETIGWSLLLILAILTIASLVLDYLGGVIGAKKYGATRWGLIGSVIGGIVGFLGGVIIKLVISVVIIGIFIIKLF